MLIWAALFPLAPRLAGAATLEPHALVRGAEVVTASVRAGGGTWRTGPWDDIDRTPVDPGRYQVRFSADGEH